MVTFDFNKTPITQIADSIIIDASNKGASDIHLDPRENGIMTRIRIDGDLVDYAYIPKMYERNLTTRIKLMSNMNITESRLPQDGAIKGKFGDKELDMRVSCLPTNEGEKIVIRILDYSRSLAGLDKLGFNRENYQKLLRMIGNPNGIILITGATGSGKSTTVYSILQALNKEQTNIITVEDPIEMNIEGMNQVQVNSDIGLDFAAVLRSILRQDPNVILIGEIRDSETAQIAVRASITGHLVLSTIHTNNSLSTIERLLDMDVEKYLLSSAITGIISQRLAKMVCPKCRVKRKTTPYEKKVFNLALRKEINEIYDANHEGCSYCHKGYKGRIAIQEVLEITEDIKNAINNSDSNKEKLRTLVYGSGNVITLLQDGLRKILGGFTTFEEIYRIIEIDNDIEDSCIEVNSQTPKEEQKKLLEKDVETEKNIENTENSTNAKVISEAVSKVDSYSTPIRNNISNITTSSQISSIINNKNIDNKSDKNIVVKKVNTKVESTIEDKEEESKLKNLNNGSEDKPINNKTPKEETSKPDNKSTSSNSFFPNPDINSLKNVSTSNSEKNVANNKVVDNNNKTAKEETSKFDNKSASSNSFFPNPDINSLKNVSTSNSEKNVANDKVVDNNDKTAKEEDSKPDNKSASSNSFFPNPDINSLKNISTSNSEKNVANDKVVDNNEKTAKEETSKPDNKSNSSNSLSSINDNIKNQINKQNNKNSNISNTIDAFFNMPSTNFTNIIIIIIIQKVFLILKN